jgi:hypothetical protein
MIFRNLKEITLIINKYINQKYGILLFTMMNINQILNLLFNSLSF